MEASRSRSRGPTGSSRVALCGWPLAESVTRTTSVVTASGSGSAERVPATYTPPVASIRASGPEPFTATENV